MANTSKQLAEFPKNSFEKIIISESNWKDKIYIDIRVWYLDESTGEYKPTKKGVSIQKDEFEDFLEFLKKVAIKK